MDKAIKKLRKKYIISASLIAFSVILLMLILLNVITLIVFRSFNRNTHEMIQQAAHSYDYNTETFLLSDMETNKDGDHIIPCSVDSIDSVTLKGEITGENFTQNWYSAGGGLMYQLTVDGTEKFAYREYTFNKNTSEVTIDFKDNSTLRFEEQSLRACSASFYVRIFKHDFVGDKEKIYRHTVVWQGFLTQSTA